MRCVKENETIYHSLSLTSLLSQSHIFLYTLVKGVPIIERA